MSADIPDIASAWYPYALEWPIFAAGAALQLAALAALLFAWRRRGKNLYTVFSRGDITEKAVRIRKMPASQFSTVAGLVSCLLLAAFGILNHDAVLIAAQFVFAVVFLYVPKTNLQEVNRSDEPHI